MATQGTYYLDAPSLATATVVYQDQGLTVLAPDGYYSDGTIVRQQVAGVLLPVAACPACANPCGDVISLSAGAQGIYYMNTNLGEDTGAVIVRFNSFSGPEGVSAIFNGVTYNKLVSPTFGALEGSPDLPTFVGDTAANCGIPTGSPYSLDEFEYDGTSFAPLGTVAEVPVLAGQMELTAGAPGNMVMVIPKPTASPSLLFMQFIGACTETTFNIEVGCPAPLTSFASSGVSDEVNVCFEPTTQTYYVAHVNGAAGVLGLYDLVFSDVNGVTKLGAGYYKTTAAGANDWFQVDANGVIIAFGVCEVIPTIQLGTPDCKRNGCNDNALCAVEVPINTTNAPAGAYITLVTDAPPSTASVSLLSDAAPTGRLLYSEPDGSATPVYFTLELRNSVGAIIATQNTSLTHQSFWQFLDNCVIP